MADRSFIVSGIQQIGIGTSDVYETWAWYHRFLNMDIPVFDEAAEANLMLPYTDGIPQKRHAVLALNLAGGGGTEIWQYTSRVPQAPDFKPIPGDLGLFAAQFKSRDISKTRDLIKQNHTVSELMHHPVLGQSFFTRDLHGNPLQIVESKQWFGRPESHSGGVAGAIIGVSDIHRSTKFYKDVIGMKVTVMDKVDEGFYSFFNGKGRCKRVVLQQPESIQGPFSELLGPCQLTLIEAQNHQPRKIFENRLWGDLGFIHLCFDVVDIDHLKAFCEKNNSPFQVDSGNFEMGDAAGRFAYIEDPDGTLIEFVETYKVPILKKFNWYLDLRKRTKGKTLPKWMLKAMGLNRVKEVTKFGS